MGLLETALERASISSIAGFLVFMTLLWTITNRVDKYLRLRRLSGARGKIMPGTFPLGIPFVYRAVKAARNHTSLDFWTDNFTAIGRDTGETNVLGQPLISTMDPENIKAILATQFSDFGKGEPFHREWKDFLGDSIFTTDGHMWHTSRQLIRPQFIRDRVSDLHCFESHIQILFRAIANGGVLSSSDQPVDFDKVNGQVLDISDLLFRYTLDCATEFLLGHDVQSMTTPNEKFAKAFNEVQRVQSVLARAGRFRHFIDRKSFFDGLEVLNSFMDQYIERALLLSPEELASKAKSDKGYTFLHELASFTRDRKVLRDQLIAVLLAGRDTTASTLSWTLYELGRHPDAVRKLRAEILEHVGPVRAPNYADLKAMKYLQNVMNETSRLYPVVPFNVRLALRDTTLPRGGGPDGSEPLPVLKNTPVSYSTLAMQRRADLYPPPSDTFAPHDVFSPDRWFHWQPKPWTFIPFNGGPRICIGQQFALTEMSYVLCRLFQRYERIESYMHDIDGGDPCLKADIVLQPGHGVKVAFWEAEK
ncbi:hypothetical protein ACRALDRAFT_1039882 [Sodiomyces alcalophilus JCM 7366]|uniref:uncharacterized protein n=1 Tax=Sodiomyces alcalophilus JCM 7366 TaxID=591952 RepID=UPI0039B5F03C